MGEVVQLGLTKYALLIIQAHMILHYHPFYASQIEVTSESLPNSNSGNVEITVYDKSWHDNTTVHRSKLEVKCCLKWKALDMISRVY